MYPQHNSFDFAGLTTLLIFCLLTVCLMLFAIPLLPEAPADGLQTSLGLENASEAAKDWLTSTREEYVQKLQGWVVENATSNLG